MSYDAGEPEIKELFKDCGNLVHINLLKSPKGFNRGLAFIKFGSEAALQKALALNGVEHMERTLVIEKAKGKQ